MPQIPKPQKAYKVAIIESKGGRDSKVVEEVYFDNDEEAHVFIKEYNDNNNNNSQSPVRYLFAVYHGLMH